MEQFNSVVNQNLGWVHTNKYVLPVVSVVLAVYVAMLRPKLPPSVERVFSNPVFRLVVLSYIAFRDTNEPVLSVMMAVAFLVTMYMIDKQSSERVNEGFPICGICCHTGVCRICGACR